MPPRPRRSAAQRASAAITDIADRDIAMSSRSRRLVDGRSSGRAPSADSNLSSVRASGPRKRQSGATAVATSRREDSADVPRPSRRPTRGPKKRYVESESSEEEDDDDDDAEEDDDDDEEEEEEERQDEIKVGDSDMDLDGLGDEDAEGEADDMELDAEGEPEDLGEEDAEGDIDMDVVAPSATAATPSIKVSKPTSGASGARGRGRPAASAVKSRGGAKRRRTGGGTRKRARLDDDDEEEDEAEEDDSIVAEGEINASVEVAGDEEDAEGEDDDEVMEEDDEEDAEGETEMHGDEEDAEGEEEIEVADEEGDNDDEEDAEGDSELGSRAGTPDLTKMTRRQRARFEETPQEYMKLSDEVQVKKVFTAEELSMRRAEMARRRRNLSEKRNEEVKTETINKLLKRQAPKTTKKNAMANDDSGDEDGHHRPDPVMIRWISNKQGSRVVVPVEILESPAGLVLQSS